jgi:hypothetical protein
MDQLFQLRNAVVDFDVLEIDGAVGLGVADGDDVFLQGAVELDVFFHVFECGIGREAWDVERLAVDVYAINTCSEFIVSGIDLLRNGAGFGTSVGISSLCGSQLESSRVKEINVAYA